MIQKLSAHMKLQIGCALCPSLSKRTHLLFLNQFSSTLANSCVAIFCHNLGASTLPWRRHRLNEILLSTHSNIACPTNPDISRRRAEINHPCVLWLHKCCHVPRSCLIERRIDVHVCQVHCGADHTAMPQHGSSVLLPFPVFLQ